MKFHLDKRKRESDRKKERERERKKEKEERKKREKKRKEKKIKNGCSTGREAPKVAGCPFSWLFLDHMLNKGWTIHECSRKGVGNSQK